MRLDNELTFDMWQRRQHWLCAGMGHVRHPFFYCFECREYGHRLLRRITQRIPSESSTTVQPYAGCMAASVASRIPLLATL